MVRRVTQAKLAGIVRGRGGKVTTATLARKAGVSLGVAYAFLSGECVRVLDSETMEVIRWMVR